MCLFLKCVYKQKRGDRHSGACSQSYVQSRHDEGEAKQELSEMKHKAV